MLPFLFLSRDEHLDYASMQTIKEWLDSIKMGQYARNFTDEGYSTPRQIFDITDQRLQELGIQLLGHKNKILKNIQTTKDQVMKKQIERTKSMKL